MLVTTQRHATPFTVLLLLVLLLVLVLFTVTKTTVLIECGAVLCPEDQVVQISGYIPHAVRCHHKLCNG